MQQILKQIEFVQTGNLRPNHRLKRSPAGINQHNFYPICCWWPAVLHWLLVHTSGAQLSTMSCFK